MFGRLLDHRGGHYVLLTVVWALLCLPNLGGPSLWDVDEGNNAEASREMWRSGNYVVPTFNYQLREDKPALLYWLQTGAYAACGVNEFAARLPSALAALLTVLVTYELGRQTFGKRAALLAGLILASTVGFDAAAHFANPDALLLACTSLTLLLFWHDYRRGGQARWWGGLVLAGATTGLGVLAKGPIGLVLPVAVTHLFLLWQRQPGRLWDRQLIGAALLFLAVAAPWYAWVALETKGAWLVGFWENHHVKRMSTPLEGHGGPVFYYVLVLLAGLVPWSVFLGPAGWHALRRLRTPEGPDSPRAAVRFLLSWLAVYFCFFSLVRTKLPNYVLPLYPAAALLLGDFLDRWRRGVVALPAWVVRLSLICLALLGVGVGVGLLAAGGALELPALRGRYLPGLEAWAGLGGVLVAAAGLGWWCARHGRRGGVIAAVAGCAVAFNGAAAFGVAAVDRYKSARVLAGALPADQDRREVRLATHDYFQPSLVFYCRREVACLEPPEQALAFLRGPLPSYLFVPAPAWQRLRGGLDVPCRVVARHYDLYRACDVLLVGNPAGVEERGP
jgi:4-amino-4-deoxy-L-arabinose transferase-like glycosyltransferase